MIRISGKLVSEKDVSPPIPLLSPRVVQLNYSLSKSTYCGKFNEYQSQFLDGCGICDFKDLEFVFENPADISTVFLCLNSFSCTSLNFFMGFRRSNGLFIAKSFDVSFESCKNSCWFSFDLGILEDIQKVIIKCIPSDHSTPQCVGVRFISLETDFIRSQELSHQSRQSRIIKYSQFSRLIMTASTAFHKRIELHFPRIDSLYARISKRHSYGTFSMNQTRHHMKEFFDGICTLSFSHLHIAFTLPYSIQGVLFFCDGYYWQPKDIDFVFHTRYGESITIEQQMVDINSIKTVEWHQFDVGFDVLKGKEIVSCDIICKGSKNGNPWFQLRSIRFIRDDSEPFSERSYSYDSHSHPDVVTSSSLFSPHLTSSLCDQIFRSGLSPKVFSSFVCKGIASHAPITDCDPRTLRINKPGCFLDCSMDDERMEHGAELSALFDYHSLIRMSMLHVSFSKPYSSVFDVFINAAGSKQGQKDPMQPKDLVFIFNIPSKTRFSKPRNGRGEEEDSSKESSKIIIIPCRVKKMKNYEWHSLRVNVSIAESCDIICVSSWEDTDWCYLNGLLFSKNDIDYKKSLSYIAKKREERIVSVKAKSIPGLFSAARQGDFVYGIAPILLGDLTSTPFCAIHPDVIPVDIDTSHGDFVSVDPDFMDSNDYKREIIGMLTRSERIPFSSLHCFNSLFFSFSRVSVVSKIYICIDNVSNLSNPKDLDFVFYDSAGSKILKPVRIEIGEISLILSETKSMKKRKRKRLKMAKQGNAEWHCISFVPYLTNIIACDVISRESYIGRVWSGFHGIRFVSPQKDPSLSFIEDTTVAQREEEEERIVISPMRQVMKDHFYRNGASMGMFCALGAAEQRILSGISVDSVFPLSFKFSQDKWIHRLELFTQNSTQAPRDIDLVITEVSPISSKRKVVILKYRLDKPSSSLYHEDIYHIPLDSCPIEKCDIIGVNSWCGDSILSFFKIKFVEHTKVQRGSSRDKYLTKIWERQLQFLNQQYDNLWK
ncbi:hypothetical protein ADUPG1_007846 [Aduncisulcus paluster]|uniref:Uncharacterized protein n=1 Tax=Aduncisulcus paluster TaxID=2918883 RepID=A0ABQ5KPU5_9EUKA|nr:hypothetical protein ADUPG1_007846 [Aduncisulcus paluster]